MSVKLQSNIIIITSIDTRFGGEMSYRLVNRGPRGHIHHSCVQYYHLTALNSQFCIWKETHIHMNYNTPTTSNYHLRTKTYIDYQHVFGWNLYNIDCRPVRFNITQISLDNMCFAGSLLDSLYVECSWWYVHVELLEFQLLKMFRVSLLDRSIK